MNESKTFKNGYEKFVAEIGVILDNTKKEIAKNDKLGEQHLKMATAIANQFAVFVRSECKANNDFHRQVYADWKSAARMLKFVSAEAKKLAVKGCAMVPDQTVFDWIRDYYFLDDKEEVMAERKAEAERKAKAEAEARHKAELTAKAEVEAKEVLATDEEYQNADEKKQKEIFKKKVKELVAKAEKAERAAATREKKKREKAEAEAKALKELEGTPEYQNANKKEQKKMLADKVKEMSGKPSKATPKATSVASILNAGADARENLANNTSAQANISKIRDEKPAETTEFQQMNLMSMLQA